MKKWNNTNRNEYQARVAELIAYFADTQNGRHTQTHTNYNTQVDIITYFKDSQVPYLTEYVNENVNKDCQNYRVSHNKSWQDFYAFML